MEQTRTGACIAICKEMDGTPRIPWFGVGATLQTMADLYDTPNGYPPAPTEEDMGDGANFGEEGWLEFHPLRVLDGGITLRVLDVDPFGARVEYDLFPRVYPGDEEEEGPPGSPCGVMSVWVRWAVMNPNLVAIVTGGDSVPVFDSPPPSPPGVASLSPAASSPPSPSTSGSSSDSWLG